MRFHHILNASLLATCYLLLTSCAAQPKPAPLPYRFTLASFEDLRPEEERTDPRLIGQPFRPRTFVQSLRTQLPSSLFGGMDAKLNVRLKHYEITRFKESFALSMVAEIGGEDVYGRPLLTQDCACSQVEKEGFRLADYATQVYEERNLESLTPEGRTASMWQKLYDACVQELVMQYATALDTASLAPAAGKANQH